MSASEQLARAALAELREPTEAMAEAADQLKLGTGTFTQVLRWRAMVDEALR